MILWDAATGVAVKTIPLEFAPVALDWKPAAPEVAVVLDEKLSETKHRCMKYGLPDVI